MNFSWQISEYLKILEHFGWMQWILFSIAVNIFLYFFSIGLYIFIEKTCRKNQLQDCNHPITQSDFYTSFLTIVCNCLVLLLGVFLWKNNLIKLDPYFSATSIVLETIVLILLMDFCMYLFHYAAHLQLVYKILHRKHHEHVNTNFLSLFVLHPIETIGFGLMILALLICYDFSVVSIAFYLFINLVWGTIGHLNREFFPSKFNTYFVGTTQFHNQHHVDESKNFGFYTSIWDRLFGTYKM